MVALEVIAATEPRATASAVVEGATTAVDLPSTSTLPEAVSVAASMPAAVRPWIVTTERAPAPASVAASAAVTLVASTVCSVSAVTSMLPASAVTPELPIDASTSSPTVLSASETATATPTTLIAAATDTIVASIVAVSSASTNTPCAARTPVESSTNALTSFAIVLRDVAPEPANANVVPAARAAAADDEWMPEVSCAETRMSPRSPRLPAPSPSARTWVSAFEIEASTALRIWLSASDTATAPAAPTGANENATAAAATSAWIVELSVAERTMPSASMPAPSPSMRALTTAALTFCAVEPAPAPVMPTRPVATAAAIASTSASITCSDSAVTVNIDPAEMPVSCV